jgi:hypothetical protein
MTLLLCEAAGQGAPKKQKHVSKSIASLNLELGGIPHLIETQRINWAVAAV